LFCRLSDLKKCIIFIYYNSYLKTFTCRIFSLLLFTFSGVSAFSQNVQKTDRCGSEVWLQQMFDNYPQFKVQYQGNEKKLGQVISERIIQHRENQNARTAAIITIPIVFHVVTNNQASVTNAMILAQLDTLNKDWAGLNADSAKLPAAFKPLFGKSNIRFCLARRTPDDQPTNGIHRVTTDVMSDGSIGDAVKYTSKGGTDAWDPLRFVNVWVVRFTNSSNLGYATYPIGTPENSPPGSYPISDQGIVIAAGTLPGGNIAPYNLGRTLTHEAGHYFWLRHITGDINCGNDFPNTPGIDDTPAQSDLTLGCPSGVVATGCAASSNPAGRMYQNYMDYTDDACMALFTKGQNIRSELALDMYRTTLKSSNGCIPVNLANRDAKPVAFIEPRLTVCDPNNVKPVVQVINLGNDTIKSININYSINNSAFVTLNFTTNIGYDQFANFTLNATSFNRGNNVIKVYTSQPNGLPDEKPLNDTLVYTFRVLTPVEAPLVEGFESPAFPPNEWEITQQPEDGITWQRTTQAGKNSTASAYMDNFDYAANNRIDDLITPLIIYSGADSVFFKFDIAAATYSFPGSTAIPLDTLQVLVTTDCGKTFTSIYKKWGVELQTLNDPNSQTLTEFIPNNFQWRTDSINVTSLLGSANSVRFAFRNTTNFENNIYIDNVTFRTKVLPAKLKETGFLINPSPFTNSFAIQSFNVTDLRAYAVYSSIGQLIKSKTFTGRADNFIEVNMQNQPSGIYIVKLIYSNRTVSQRVIKIN
jgi:hypothetical protein